MVRPSARRILRLWLPLAGRKAAPAGLER
jgi:hypothetical protein